MSTAPKTYRTTRQRDPYFMVDTAEFFVRTRTMSLTQVGRLITDACNAALNGDRSFFDGHPYFYRAALFVGNPLYIPPRIRREVYDRDGRKCKHCGATERLSIDHIRARANGGTDDIGNLQTLCMPCNRRKGVQ